MHFVNQDQQLSITISVLIVEDDWDQAFNIKKSVERYRSVYLDKSYLNKKPIEIEYKAVINGQENLLASDFKGNLAFSMSIEYLNNISSNPDIILCDFDLGNKKGVDILRSVQEIEKAKNIRIYKVLHSVYPEYQKFQKEPFVDFLWDAKTREAIQKITLLNYEQSILTPILFGNPLVYERVYSSFTNYEFALKQNIFEKTHIRTIPVYRILCIYSIGRGNNRFIYTNEAFEICEGGYNGTISEYTSENLFFIKVSDSLYINKLWYADHNIPTECIKFIRQGGSLFTLKIDDITKGRSHDTGLTHHYSKIRKEQIQSDFPEFSLDNFFKL
jgi:CheY-like chemotaxis protein